MSGDGDQTVNRDLFIKIRVNATEKAIVEAAAAALELGVSEFTRQAWFEKVERDVRPAVAETPTGPPAQPIL